MEDDTFSKDEEILIHLKNLEDKFYPKKSQKYWQKTLCITNGELTITPQQLEDDFNRELQIYGATLKNSVIMIEKLINAKIPVWRPNDYKAETFKSDEHMAKVQKSLEDIKKKMEVVEKRRQAKNNKKFGNEAHKRHVKAKQMRHKEKTLKKEKSGKEKSAKFQRKRKNK